MKRRLIVDALAALALASAPLLPLDASAQVSASGRQMVEATMKAYDKLIAQNPKDFRTLYRRANGYYSQNKYSKALTDINAGIAAAPATDKAYLLDAYNLRGGIYERLGRYTDAIADYKKALTFNPKDYTTAYQLANLQFEAGDYAAAKQSYTKLQRLNSRSQEALFGLARVAVKEGNVAKATSLLDDAVKLNPTSAVSYMRQASVLNMMGDNAGAVESLATALSIDRTATPHALRELARLANEDYSGVMNGLQKAIDSSSHPGSLYYIRAVIARSHFHYLPALSDLQTILDKNLVSSGSVYNEMAECLYNLGDYAAALQKVDYAIGLGETNFESYLLKSRIKCAQGQYKSAVENADKALSIDPESARAFCAKGLAQEGWKLYPEANVSLGHALTLDNRHPIYYMERAYLLTNGLNMPSAAADFYTDLCKLDYPTDDVVSLYGFGQLYLGNVARGDVWMDNITSTAKDSDGEVAYYAACYWAHRGETDKALDFMEKSLQKGYASYHNWTQAIDGGVNVAPLRDDPRFADLLKRYANLFK